MSTIKPNLGTVEKSLLSQTLPDTLENQNVNEDQMYSLNAYRAAPIFRLPIEPLTKYSEDQPVVGGVRSLFNSKYGIMGGELLRHNTSSPLMDAPEIREEIRDKSDCSINTLVSLSYKGDMGRQYYDYSDFAYCKYLGKVSNNYLITLRRFPFPAGDHIDYFDPNSQIEQQTQKHKDDVGRMVTWMGVSGNDMSKILTYDFNMNWTDMTAGTEENNTDMDENKGVIAKLFALTDDKYAKEVQQGKSGTLFNDYVSKHGITNSTLSMEPPYSRLRGWRDQNKTYGPVDVIMKTKRRDKGLEFSHSITLVFEYELKSYNGINGKAAMLDLLANILAVTHTSATGFWGGTYRGVGAHQSNLYANLPIFKDAASGKLNSIDSLVASLFNTAGAIGNMFNMDTLKTIGGNLLQMITGGLLNKMGRPQKVGLNSLLTDQPVGLWHLTIGNPRNPILTMGNMVVTKTTIEHNGRLGIDDFPTGLKVTVTLEHGKPRANQEIEKMYFKGEDRIYIPMGDEVKRMYNGAKSLNNSEVKVNENGARIVSELYGGLKQVDDYIDPKIRRFSSIRKTYNMSKDAIKTCFSQFGVNDEKGTEVGSLEVTAGSSVKSKKTNDQSSGSKE